jgi:hypothetical protein
MGLSQGCAASIVAALLWRGEAFGALVGMCGYLPFRKGMNDVVEEAESEHDDLFQGSMQEEEDDIFARDVEEPEHRTKFERAVEWLREELQTRVGEMDAAEPQSMQSIPICRVSKQSRRECRLERVRGPGSLVLSRYAPRCSPVSTKSGWVGKSFLIGK